MSFVITVLISILSSNALAQKKLFKVRTELPKSSRFLTPTSKLRESDRIKFETIASSRMPSLQFTYALGDSFKECGLGMIDGFNAIVWDPVKNASYGLWNMATDTRRWVERSHQEVKSLGNTLSNFETFASKQWANWRQKTPQEKSRIYCSFLGGAGVAGAATKVTGPLSSNLAGKAGIATETAATGTANKTLYKSGKAPDDLAGAARWIVEPDSPYIGRSWYQFPRGGVQSYPYILACTSLSSWHLNSAVPH